ncbi:MAG: hypothetical protein K8H89_10295 [Flavobacteriales bacterium]|jgi:hypothetical protein|nr:hypothetical protein [Flavobacteriales bacterium]
MAISIGWKRVERWLYPLLVAVHLVPILAPHWFVTLDGPSHLYSARIVRSLVLGDPFFHRFFHLSTYPEPYWLGHAAMAVLLGFLPAWAVGKVMWCAAVIGLALAFRFLVRTIAPTRVWTSFLVMPFLLNYALRLGFLNFCLSLALLFLALAMAWRGIQHGRMKATWLALAMVLLYFAHLSTFLLCVGMLSALWAWAWLISGAAERHNLRRIALGLCGALVLPLALVAGYVMSHHPAQATVARLPFSDLWRYIIEGRSWNALGTDGEHWACIVTAVPMLFAGIAALVLRAKLIGNRKWCLTDFWPLLTLASFAAYFLIPDVVAGGSSVSPRLLLFSMFFLACTAAISELPDRLLLPAVALVVLADLHHTRIQYASSVSLGRECAELMSVQGELADRSVLLPLNYSGNWMHSNLSSHLGTGKARVVVLDHFTALAPFNPEQWNEAMKPYGPIGNFASSNTPCIRIAGYADSTGVAVDAVLTWKMNAAAVDSCLSDVQAQLRADFLPVASSPHGDAQLFRHR